MSWEDVIPEEEERMIQEAAELIYKHGMEVPAVFTLEIIKPFAYIGGEFGRFFLTPFTPILGEKFDRYLSVFKKRENIEKVIKLIEKKVSEEKEKKDKKNDNEKSDKKGWKKFWPF